MKSVCISISLLLMLALLFGCGNRAVNGEPQVSWMFDSEPVSNDCFEARVVPSDSVGGRFGFVSLTLTIKNNTSQDIEIDWNKTAFLFNGQTHGGFMFEGVVYKDRNAPKSPDIVFSGQSFTKKIFPNNLVTFSRGVGWINNPIPPGKVGVYLVATCGKSDVREKLLTTIEVR